MQNLFPTNNNDEYLKNLDEAIEALKKGDIEVAKLSRAVIIRYATQLKNNPNKEITSRDVKNFWEMSRRRGNK